MPEHRKKAAAKRAIYLYNFAVNAPFWQRISVTLRGLFRERESRLLLLQCAIIAVAKLRAQ